MNTHGKVFHPVDGECTVKVGFNPESKLVTVAFSRTVDTLTLTRDQAEELARDLMRLAKADRYQRRREENEAVLKRMKV